ncbi:MAG: TIGR04013 family B12-binding domain/radical SAM domain-containing protein [Crenarchaeota archaeon]|nr:TIGR04013 family B12-binding domain/radical SAM domain-containing protein [Thermoproteota archaeon]
MKLLYLHLLRKDVKYSAYSVISIVESSGFKAGFVKDPLEALRYAGKYKVVLGATLLTPMLLDEGLLEGLRKVSGRLFLVAGGPHATGDPWGTLALGFDAAVHGEGEETLPELLRALEEGDDWRRVKGVYSDEGFAGPRGLARFEEFPPWPYWRGLAGPMEITRGCPFACAYCQASFMFKALVRHRPVEDVLRYARIMKDLGLRDLRFITPNALSYGGDGTKLRLEAVEELLSKLKGLNMRIFFGSFPSEVRPEFVTEESIRVLKRYVSNRRLVIGAQSASEAVLKRVRRGHGWEEVVRAVELSVEHGFVPEVDFILGLPGETEEEMMETLEGMKYLAELGARAHLHYFMPLPGTPLAFSDPTPLPPRVRREVAKLVGEGKGWGQWLKQEEVAWRIVELRRKGVILPKRASKVVA